MRVENEVLKYKDLVVCMEYFLKNFCLYLIDRSGENCNKRYSLPTGLILALFFLALQEPESSMTGSSCWTVAAPRWPTRPPAACLTSPEWPALPKTTKPTLESASAAAAASLLWTRPRVRLVLSACTLYRTQYYVSYSIVLGYFWLKIKVCQSEI